MARADVASVAQRILPEGVRPDGALIQKIEDAIDATIVDVSEGASYVEEMTAKQKNEDEAVKKLEGNKISGEGDSKPKQKGKTKK